MTMEQKLHELLCAYALGEADAAQKIEVERALAASPELRGELERIEETIGLVRQTLGEGETMSAEAEEALMSAVNPEPPRTAWYSSGWVRMAASVLVIGGGALWMQMLYERNSEHMAPEDVALLRDEERRAAQGLRGLGYIGDAGEKDLVAQLDDKDRSAPSNPNPLLQGASMRPPLAQSEAARDPASTPPETLDRKAVPPADAAGEITFNFSSQDQLNGQGKPEWRGQLSPDPSYRGAGAAPAPVPRNTPKGSDGSDPFTEAGLSGAGGHTSYRLAQDEIRRPGGGGGGRLGEDVSQVGPATSSPPAAASGPSRESYEGLAAAGAAGKRDGKGGTAEYKNELEKEGKAKAEELAKKAAELDSNSDSFSLGTPPKGQPAVRDEAQVRLRALLERADGDSAERLARLKGAEAKGFGYTGYTGNDDASLRQLYFRLTPEQRAQLLEQECRQLFDGCRRRPNEQPRDMFFRYWGDNPFELSALDPLSTFSADVDTASYTLARRYLVEGKLPGKAQIRTEEFVNYFKADVAAPTKGTFAIHTDLAPSRFAQPANSTWTLRVVVRGKELPKEERKPLNLTCVIDCSGSMREQNRLETVKDTLRLLLSQLNSADRVGIVAYSTDARQVLPLTSVANRSLIEAAIGQLVPDGWTNSEGGLKLGYETALAGLDAQATNRVIFLSDGVANVGVTDSSQLAASLAPIREKGVYLNTIGVGMNNHNDTLLEQLADKGDGVCSYIDDMSEAKRVMLDNFMGSVETIARDVKIQVDFDPAQVARYRLLGYENRAVADADFRNDKVDAGEIGAGHQVTALYEIERNHAVTGEKPLATVRLRWKAPRIVNGPANEEATELAKEVRGSQQTSFEGADAGYRRAVIVGQFAEFLRRSVHARGRRLDDLLVEAHKLEAQVPQDAEFRELVALAERSKQLVLRNLPNCDELCQAIDAYRTWQYQCAQAERLSHDRQQQIVEDLVRQNRDMEEKIRELLRRRLEGTPK